MYKGKRTLAVAFMVSCMALGSGTSVSAAQPGMGRLDIGVKIKAPASTESKRKARSAGLPSYYKSPYITSIKDQGKTGLCWAFATVAIGEASAIRQGQATTSVDYSERHLGFFTYGVGQDPLGNTNKDKTVITGEDWKSLGGSILLSTTALSGWKGYAAESVAPFSSLSAVAASKARENSAIMTNANYLGDFSDKTAIKNAIVSSGSIEAAYFASGSADPGYLSDGNEDDANHAIAVVGWDDNYSRDNFKVNKPKKNGAWIVKNSWGKEVGDNGFYYISYEEKSLCEPATVKVDKTSAYQNNYHYDGTIAGTGHVLAVGDGVANVYKAKKGTGSKAEYLSAVNIMSWTPGTSYSVQVYKNPKSGKPTSGKKQLSKAVTCTATYAGIHTYKLPKKIELLKGERFSIVVTAKKKAEIAEDKAMTEYINGGSKKLEYKHYTAKNQSFVYMKARKKWTDLNSSKESIRLKGFTTSKKVKTHLYYCGTKNTSYGYTGKTITPKIKLTYGKKSLKKGTDYTVKIKRKKTVGTTYVTFKGKGKYRGTRKVYYTVGPKAPKVKTVKSTRKKSVTVSIRKANGATGYQIAYRQSGASSYKKKGMKKVRQTVAGLSSKKTYYVKVRSYRTKKGKRYYGPFSKEKKVKIK